MQWPVDLAHLSDHRIAAGDAWCHLGVGVDLCPHPGGIRCHPDGRGAIDGETRTLAISIYDHVQAFDEGAAGVMAALLLVVSFVTIAVVYGLAARQRWRSR